MLATILAVFAFQGATGTINVGPKGTVIKITAHEGDSARKRVDSLKAKKKPPITPTADQLSNAFADAAARGLISRARAARLAQDSSLQAYDAMTVQRLTIGMAFSKLGRERIFFRSDLSTRVRWSRGIGAQVNVTGKRSAAPIFGGKTEVDIESVFSPIPYYPGRDAMWLGMDVVKETDDEDDIVNPLSSNGEAFYTYATGDSITFRLPDKTTVQLREVIVRPRKPDWHAVVGSLWFDTGSGQLVRAAFRMSQPARLIDDEDAPGIVARTFLHPAEASIEGVAIEYGLHQGRFWLPRAETIEGSMRVGFLRVPVKIEEKFDYASVNTLDSLPKMRERRPLPPIPDSLRSKGRSAERDSIQAARDKAECESTGSRSMRFDRFNGAIPMILFVPCDTAKLAHSPQLPGSIFDSGENVFGDAERDALLKRAESMMPNIPFVPQRPKLEYGLNLLRYNRVEGLSAAFDVTQKIAPGTELRFTPRMGTADRVFNGELSLDRTNGQGTRSISVYRRLNAVNDWGHPMTFGAGLSAFLFGRDEGFYYRSTGAELAGDNIFGREFEWRLFHEQQSDAIARTNVSVPHALGSVGFAPLDNITADRVRETGLMLRKTASFGLNPYGFRLFTDLRLEGAGGDSLFGRGALDLTLTEQIGKLSSAITASGGSSIGALPMQRHWFLGGTQSIRGQSPDTAQHGDAFWRGRLEIGTLVQGARPVLFGDIGWVGNRNAMRDVGVPMSGAGVGVSMLDGLMRLDVARGINPRKQWRVDFYLDAIF
jgi:hypothetical protein